MGENVERPNIFGMIQAKNVTFVIDTSGSMYCRLDVVKQHLKEILTKLAFEGGHKFNLIEFNTSVVQWADEMVKCLPETVRIACDWINKLEAKTGTNTEAALLAAYNDKECDALHLITDGLPDTKSHDLLDRVSYTCNGRPVHCTYLTGSTADSAATEFLQDLATDTYGSFQIVTVTNHGSVERITPVYQASHGGSGIIRTSNRKIYAGTQKQCSVTSTLDNPGLQYDAVMRDPRIPVTPYALPISLPGGVASSLGPHPGVTYPHPAIPGPRVYTDESGRVLRVPYFNYAWSQWYQPYLWARYRTARSWLKMSEDLDGALSDMSISPSAGALMIDQPVLARRTEDGLYYRGRVKSQISADRFLVELSACQTGKFLTHTYQETFIFDIIQYNDAKRHSIMKGDKVMAPLSGGSDVFCPGAVINGQEARDCPCKDTQDEELIVMFANGKSGNILPGEAMWIDQLLYDRTTFELKLPKKVRQQISDTVAKYPEDSYPGYPVSGPDRDPEEWEHPRKFYTGGDDATFQPHSGLEILRESFYRPESLRDMSQRSQVTREEVERHIPGTDLTRSQLEKKVGAQIDEHRHVLNEDDRRMSRRRMFERKREALQRQKQGKSADISEIDRDLSILDAEMKYKMQLRDQAIEQKKREIDADIDMKILEREELMAERKAILRNSPMSRLSRSRERSPEIHRKSRTRSISTELSPRPEHRERPWTRRSRSRSLSTERSPSLGRRSPRSRSVSRTRSRSLSPMRRSVGFDESLNERYFYDKNRQLRFSDTLDSGYCDSMTRDSSTNTPVIRNGRVLKLKEKKDERPDWKYWKADPIPDTIAPPLHEPYRATATPEPLECRDVNLSTGTVENQGSQFHQVIPNGRTNYERFMRTPPSIKSVSFQDNSNVHVQSGSNLVYRPSREDRKLQFRQQESQRRLNDSKLWHNTHGVAGLMQDDHRNRISAQLNREKSRQLSAKRQIESTVAHKDSLNRELRKTQNNSYAREMNATSYKREVAAARSASQSMTSDQKRVAAMAARRQERDMLTAAQLIQQQSDQKRCQSAKNQRANMRDSQVTKRLMNEMARERN